MIWTFSVGCVFLASLTPSSASFNLPIATLPVPSSLRPYNASRASRTSDDNCNCYSTRIDYRTYVATPSITATATAIVIPYVTKYYNGSDTTRYVTSTQPIPGPTGASYANSSMTSTNSTSNLWDQLQSQAMTVVGSTYAVDNYTFTLSSTYLVEKGPISVTFYTSVSSSCSAVTITSGLPAVYEAGPTARSAIQHDILALAEATLQHPGPTATPDLTDGSNSSKWNSSIAMPIPTSMSISYCTSIVRSTPGHGDQTAPLYIPVPVSTDGNGVGLSPKPMPTPKQRHSTHVETISVASDTMSAAQSPVSDAAPNGQTMAYAATLTHITQNPVITHMPGPAKGSPDSFKTSTTPEEPEFSKNDNGNLPHVPPEAAHQSVVPAIKPTTAPLNSAIQCAMGISADCAPRPSDKAQPIPAPSPHPQIITAGNHRHTISSVGPSALVIDALATITPGGRPVTIKGQTFSVPSTPAAVVVGTHTVPITYPKAPPSPLQEGHLPKVAQQIITFNNAHHTITPAGSSDFVLDSSITLHAGAPGITVSGKRYSLPSSPTAIIIGSHTIPLSASLTLEPQPNIPARPETLTLPHQTLTLSPISNYNPFSNSDISNPSSLLVLDSSHTLTPGASALTFSGKTYSLPATPTALIINNSQTIPLSSALACHMGACSFPSSTAPPGAKQTMTVGDKTLTLSAGGGKSQIVIDGSVTVSAGGPAKTVDGMEVKLPKGGKGGLSVGPTKHLKTTLAATTATGTEDAVGSMGVGPTGAATTSGKGNEGGAAKGGAVKRGGEFGFAVGMVLGVVGWVV